MRKYVDIIKSALEEVPNGYYKLRTTYAPKGIVRERVFCYELYHRIRQQLGEVPILIHGEIDKRGHQRFEREDQRNPDFVFHIPGKMEENTVVVEVKGNLDTSNYRQKVAKDFVTLINFINKYHYKIGIFISYNYSMEDFKGKMYKILRNRFNNYNSHIKKQIIILCIKKAKSSTQECTLYDILESGVYSEPTSTRKTKRKIKGP
jgi:hypothetical protein